MRAEDGCGEGREQQNGAEVSGGGGRFGTKEESRRKVPRGVERKVTYLR